MEYMTELKSVTAIRTLYHRDYGSPAPFGDSKRGWLHDFEERGMLHVDLDSDVL